MIAKSIEGSIAKTSLKKLRISHGEYEWTDAGGLISNYGTITIYLLFKGLIPDTRIGV